MTQLIVNIHTCTVQAYMKKIMHFYDLLHLQRISCVAQRIDYGVV